MALILLLLIGAVFGFGFKVRILKWNSVFQRFRRWAKRGVWERIFGALVEHPDFEYLIVDSTIVRAHQHAAGAKGGAPVRRSAVRVAA